MRTEEQKQWMREYMRKRRANRTKEQRDIENARMMKYYSTHKEQYEVDREKWKQENREKYLEYARTKSKQWRINNSERNSILVRASEARAGKHVKSAHDAVRRAVEYGRLTKLDCEYWWCEDSRTHAHHDDYSKKLDVIWLCTLHHRDRHMELKLLGINPV